MPNNFTSFMTDYFYGFPLWVLPLLKLNESLSEEIGQFVEKDC